MGRKLHLTLLAAALAGLSCQQRQDGPGEAPPADATRPANWAVPLAKVHPPLTPPADAADAQALPENALDSAKQAEAHLGQGEYGQALQQFQAARKLAPDSPRILRGLGLAHAALRNHDQAEPLLKQSAEKAPDHVRVQLLLGQYAVGHDNFFEAITHFRKALLCSDAGADNPDAAEALLRLAMVLESQGYWTAALECYDRLSQRLSASPRVFDARASLRGLIHRPEQLMLVRGRLLLQLDQSARAADLLERAYRRSKTPQAAQLAVKALLANGDFTRARAVVEEMLTMPALRAPAIHAAVQLCKAKKDPDLPGQLLEACLDDVRADPDFVIALAEAAADLGAGDAADHMLAHQLAVAPQGRTAIRVARFYGRRGKLAAAAREYAKLLVGDELTTQQLRHELDLLARRPVDRKSVDELAASAVDRKQELAPAVLCIAGMLAEVIGEVDLAKDLLGRALEQYPRFEPAYEALAELYADIDDFAAMQTLADQVAKWPTKSHFRWYLLGKIHLDRREPDQAIKKLDKARSKRVGHVPTLLLLGRAYRIVGDTKHAKDRLQSATGLAPDNLAVAEELFKLYIQRRDFAQAGWVVKRFLRDNPKSVPGQLLAARYYMLVRRPQSARQIINRLLAIAGDDVEVRLFELEMERLDPLSDQALSRQQAEAALKKIGYILKLDPGNIPALKLQAAVLGARGRHGEAAKVLEKAYTRKPYDAILAGAYLNALIEAGKQELAVDEIDKILAREPLSTTMRVALLAALTEMQRYEQAEPLLAKWLAEPADNAELSALHRQGLELYEQAKHYDAAGELLDRWINAEQDLDKLNWLRFQKLRMWALAGDFDQAAHYAAKLDPRELKPLHPKGMLAWALAKAKAYAKADKVLEEWARAGAEPKAVRHFREIMLKVCEEQEDFDALQRYACKWVVTDPAAEDVHALAVGLLSLHKKHDEAIKLAEAWEALLAEAKKLASPTATAPAAKAPDPLATARRAVVGALLRAGKKRQALARARAYVKENPENVIVLQALTAALHVADQREEYLAVTEKIYQIDPDNPDISNNLGYVWADRGINLKKAESMIRKALAARPREIAFQDSLGWVLYKQAKFQAAHKEFLEALDADERFLDAITLDHAADTCWRLGLKDQAIRLWTRAVDMAKKEEVKDTDTTKVLAETPKKIRAAKASGKPKVAPLGAGITEPGR